MSISLGGILGWIVLGGLAGWIASMIKGKNAQMGIIANIVVGVIGAFIGGILLGLFFDVAQWGIWLSFLTAILGAVILLSIINLVRK